MRAGTCRSFVFSRLPWVATMFIILLIMCHEVLQASAVSFQDNVLLNGDFEGGDLSGWSYSGDVRTITRGQDAYANNHILTAAEGQYAARIGNEVPWAVSGEPIESFISQEIVIPTSLADEPPVIQFAYAVVANDPPSHPTEDKPLFNVTVTDKTAGEALYTTDFVYTSQTSGEWYLGQGLGGNLSQQGLGMLGGDRWVFKPWQNIEVDLSGREGHLVQLKFSVRDCNLSAHPAYGYLDSVNVGERREILLPEMLGDPIPAEFIEPTFLQRSMGTLERFRFWPWILLCCPFLLLLLVPLSLMSRRRSGQTPVATASTAPPKKTERKKLESSRSPRQPDQGGFRPYDKKRESTDSGGFRPPD